MRVPTLTPSHTNATVDCLLHYEMSVNDTFDFLLLGLKLVSLSELVLVEPRPNFEDLKEPFRRPWAPLPRPRGQGAAGAACSEMAWRRVQTPRAMVRRGGPE